MNSHQIKKLLQKKSDKKRAKILQRFFKTGKGEYREGDIFLGITVPELRKIVKATKEISLTEIQKLLKSKIHEERLVAALLLVSKFEKATNPPDKKTQKEIFNFYIKNRQNINNWDLVDLSAPNIAGNYLLEKDKKILYKLSKSKKLWDRRISIVSTFSFIRQNNFSDTLIISKILLNDEHDLIHKAAGWMLREVGKRDLPTLKKFLLKNYKKMPRTMLRCSIEKFPETERKKYLSGRV